MHQCGAVIFANGLGQPCHARKELVNEMVMAESQEEAEKVRSGLRTWTSDELDEAKKAASEWGKKVF